MRPPITYYGGKVGMAERIATLMPAHRVYIEPFFGSGAVLFSKTRVTHEIVNDLDGALVAFFTCLRDRPDELERVCRLTPYAREEYAAADLDAAGLGELERARRFWVRVNQSFAKTAGTRTGWSITTARTQSVCASTQGRVDRFMACAERLSQVAIECCDGADLIDRLATSDTVVYADPPYLAATRKGITKKGDYRRDMSDQADHERLAEVLHRTPATVILSGYPSALYEDLYGDWPRHETAVQQDMATSRRLSEMLENLQRPAPGPGNVTPEPDRKETTTKPGVDAGPTEPPCRICGRTEYRRGLHDQMRYCAHCGEDHPENDREPKETPEPTPDVGHAALTERIRDALDTVPGPDRDQADCVADAVRDYLGVTEPRQLSTSADISSRGHRWDPEVRWAYEAGFKDGRTHESSLAGPAAPSAETTIPTTGYQPIELNTPDGFELEAVCLTCGAIVGDEETHSRWHDPGPTSISLFVPAVPSQETTG